MNTICTLFPPSPTHFFGGGRIFQKIGYGRQFFKKIFRGNKKEEDRGNAKVIGRWNVFISIFSLLAMMVTNTVFRKFCLKNIFEKSGLWCF